MAEPTTVDLTFLAKQNEKILAELKDMRSEHNDVRALLVQIYEHSRRVETRVTEQTKDLELMLKMELGGQFANFATRVEQRLGVALDDLAERLQHVETLVPRA
jgi:hypothetical protein